MAGHLPFSLRVARDVRQAVGTSGARPSRSEAGSAWPGFRSGRQSAQETFDMAQHSLHQQRRPLCGLVRADRPVAVGTCPCLGRVRGAGLDAAHREPPGAAHRRSIRAPSNGRISTRARGPGRPIRLTRTGCRTRRVPTRSMRRRSMPSISTLVMPSPCVCGASMRGNAQAGRQAGARRPRRSDEGQAGFRCRRLRTPAAGNLMLTCAGN